MSLTKAQRRTFETIVSFIEENSFPPSIREIQVEAGLASPSTVKYHLLHLKEKGLITYEPKKSRTVRILKSPDE